MGDFASQEPGAAAQNDLRQLDAAQKAAAAQKAHEEATRAATLSPDHAAEQDRIKQRQIDEEKGKERAQAIAEFNAHPHTQLTGILADLRRPAGLDVNGRLATLHSAVARLAQMLMGSMPAPVHPDNQKEANDGKGWQDESARGS